ncbi:MAPEG family protein [Vibrio ulleungensis]|uniref:MAPEG family protein n=1 Tax=Vibrio ulleungensis TaxID=2807619 RepID=A0ABS2HE52_9VIBR|nr:MAPEG family protein [Vibrio ulleungensis]MBM7035366.1 MAPEG family protein [Vibrio ulleungensis]
MQTLIWCLIIVALLPYIAKIPLASAMSKAGGYNNKYPRDQQSTLTGFGSRALAAHENAFESLIVFSVSVLLAIATNSATELVQILAIIHVCFRVAYHVCYLLNKDLLRSVFWFIAIGCSFSIMWQCLPSH